MLVQFQNNSEADERNVRGVMPTKFCTGNVCCNNHKAQNPREKSDCKEFVIIGKKLILKVNFESPLSFPMMYIVYIKIKIK